jgi:hypothetical protein
MDEVEIADAPLDTGFEPAAESPEFETSIETTDSGVEPRSGVETTADTNVDSPAIQHGRISDPAIRKVLDGLKADPANKDALRAHKAIQRALFTEDRLRSQFNGDLKQIDSLRTMAESLGGEQGVQEIQQELDGWRQFDEQFTAADPKVLDFITSTPEAKDAFVRLAPMVFDRYHEAHPAGYDAYIAQAFNSTMEASGIPLALERLGDFLSEVAAENPRMAKAVEQFQKLVSFNAFIQQKARTAVEPPKTATPAPDTRMADLEKRETAFRRQEYQAEPRRERDALFESTLSKHLGTDKLSPEKRDSIRTLFEKNLIAEINKKGAGVGKQLDAYLAKQQKDGFQKYLRGLYRETVPLAVRITLGNLGMLKKAPGSGTPTLGKNGAAAARTPSGKPATPGEGVRFVGGKPDFSTVDNVRTPASMWQEGKAILKNGQKVAWKK